ncbi:MAG TPA: hypothetical protein VGJ92_09810 [Methanocella sp.]|jgi:hypothetical protein
MDENIRRKIPRSAIAAVLAIIVIIVVIAALAFLFFSCLEASFVMPADYTYAVSIRDLNGATSDGNTEILIPVPYVNDRPVFSDSELTGTYSNWQSSVLMTETGKVISLKNTNALLNDVDITYNTRSPGNIYVNASTDIYLNPRREPQDQSTDEIRSALAQYLKNSEHSTFYHSSDSLVFDEANDSLVNEMPYERFSTVKINGKIRTPRSRAIAVDLNFNAVTYGESIPGKYRGYYVCSYLVTNETENVTLSPVAISGVKYS